VKCEYTNDEVKSKGCTSLKKTENDEEKFNTPMQSRDVKWSPF
jgi:hypothetical protein